MEATAYQALAESEESGWYYQARRRAIEILIRGFALRPKKNLRIIDIGCGTGGSTKIWSRYGKVLGIEPSPLARELAAKRFPELEILPLKLEELDPLKVGQFDLAIILCVLYHKNIADPASALAGLARLQEKGSVLIWNEPAYPYLWRQHDRQTAAGRRFYPKEMILMLEKAGYEIVFRSHLLSWAFPIAAFLSLMDRWRWKGDRGTTSAEEGGDHKPVPGLLNAFLRTLTLAEWQLNRVHLGLPFGVSNLLVARRK